MRAYCRLEALELLELAVLFVRVPRILSYTFVMLMVFALILSLLALGIVRFLCVHCGSWVSSGVYSSIDYFVDVGLFWHAAIQLGASLRELIHSHHCSWVDRRNQSVRLSQLLRIRVAFCGNRS